MADYNMRSSGSQVDDIVENALDKRNGGDIIGDISATSFTGDEVNVDTLATKDGSASIAVSDLCDANIVNITHYTLPTTDPSVVGRLWNDGGTLKVSAG